MFLFFYLKHKHLIRGFGWFHFVFPSFPMKISLSSNTSSESNSSSGDVLWDINCSLSVFSFIDSLSVVTYQAMFPDVSFPPYSLINYAF